MNPLARLLQKFRITTISKMDDSDKVKKIKKLKQDEELKSIILSIEDRQKRAKAFRENLHKIDDKDVIKKIMPTLKDDDIINILDTKEKYLDNKKRNVLYSTILGIDNPQKRMKSVKQHIRHLSDFEVSDLLSDLKDTDNSSKISNEKIDIISTKIIQNYIHSGFIMHIKELLECLPSDEDKLCVIKKCLEKNNNIKSRIKNGELPEYYMVFDSNGIKILLDKVFPNIKSSWTYDDRKSRIVLNLYKDDTLTYEDAKDVIQTNFKDKTTVKNALELIEKAKKEKQINNQKNLDDDER